MTLDRGDFMEEQEKCCVCGLPVDETAADTRFHVEMPAGLSREVLHEAVSRARWNPSRGRKQRDFDQMMGAFVLLSNGATSASVGRRKTRALGLAARSLGAKLVSTHPWCSDREATR
jgi:hypothetical protein